MSSNDNSNQPPAYRVPLGAPLIGPGGGLDTGPRLRSGPLPGGGVGRGVTGGGGTMRFMPGANSAQGANHWAQEVYDLERYAVLNGDLRMPVGVASVLVLPEAPATYRNLLIVRNSSPLDTQIIYLCFGSDASTGSVIRLVRNELFQWDSVVPQDEMYAISEVAGGFLSIAFSVFSIPVPP